MKEMIKKETKEIKENEMMRVDFINEEGYTQSIVLSVQNGIFLIDRCHAFVFIH
jgi:hypothetical protein